MILYQYVVGQRAAPFICEIKQKFKLSHYNKFT